MALPTSPSWNIADFGPSTIGGLLSLGPGDLTITPSTSPYFSYNSDFTILYADSRDGNEARLDFNAAIPAQFTVELEVRFPAMPHNLGDLSSRRVGLTIADDAGRGIAIYFAKTGVAVGRVDDYGSVSALPDTTDVTEQVATEFRTIRVVVDSATARAYVLVDSGPGTPLRVEYILPVEATPPSVVDRFQLFAHGTATEPVRVELRALRLHGAASLPNAPPVAVAGPDRVAPVGNSVRFDGRSSFDVEGAPLTYSWSATEVPFGSSYAAESSSGSTVDDGDADGFTPTLSFAPASLPAWVAQYDVLQIRGRRHVIDTVSVGTGVLTVFSDTIPDDLTAEPFRVIRQSILVGATTETPYAMPDVQGVYRFELVVNDGESSSEPSEVIANIVGARAPFGVEPDVSMLWRALGDEWRFIENKEIFEEVWKGCAQIFAGKLLELWQHHYNYSIRDAQRTFQRKWLAYRTVVAESAPDTAVVSARYGALAASHEFELGAPSTTGTTLTLEFFTGDTASATDTVDISLTGDTITQILTDLNTALVGTDIVAYAYGIRREDGLVRFDGEGSTADDGDGDRVTATLSFTPLSLPSWVAAGDTLVIAGERLTIGTVNNAGGTLTVTEEGIPDDLSLEPFRIYRRLRVGLRSSSRAFRVLPSTGATALGFPTSRYNYLAGTSGARVTDRVYYAGDGVDLLTQGVLREDLLVLNNGQSFRVDRILSGTNDPLPNQRVLLFEDLPFDATAEWDIPSVWRSEEVDYETQGVYPGDLAKAEVYDGEQNTFTDTNSLVVAQKGFQVAVHLDALYGAVMDPARYGIRVLGVKRRKGIPIDTSVLSIPQLQDQIPLEARDRDGNVVSTPTYWRENVDYILEPFYRDVGGAALPHLQFRDSVFIDSDTEPPDILWAELTICSNDQNVEDLFGRLVGFLRDDASTLSPDFNYVAGVAGLMYAQQRGPNVAAMRVGAQILFGQPFAEAAGSIDEIRPDWSPLQGRILIRDADGNTPSRSEVVRSYYYKKDPLDLTATSGLAANPRTGSPWAEGDDVAQFEPIGAGVDVIDMYNTPRWYVPYVRGGIITELEKFHTFLVRFNTDLVSISNLSLLQQFLLNVKPTYTHPLLVALRRHEDDIDVTDSFGIKLTLNLYDSVCGSGRAYMYDDYRGDGTLWSSFDDGLTYFDAIVDCPTDVIELCFGITWPGGTITYDSIFFYDTAVTDVSGTLGAPGSTFTPTYDMVLPAGSYRVCSYVKTGPIVLPP